LATLSTPETWRDFWNLDPPIYAGNRHKELHYALIARDVANFIGSREAHVLDHGCGEAFAAESLSPAFGMLYLFDAAPNVRHKLRARLTSYARITVLEDETLESIPNSSLDLVIANSLLQYLTRSEFLSALELWRRKMKDEGRLLLGDVVPTSASASGDARALVAFAFQGGFPLAAASSLIRTYFSNYRRLRKKLGFACYDPEELSAVLREKGFSCEVLSQNIGQNQSRKAFIARKV
jgi:SAM-dependent methyltransferase